MLSQEFTITAFVSAVVSSYEVKVIFSKKYPECGYFMLPVVSVIFLTLGTIHNLLQNLNGLPGRRA